MTPRPTISRSARRRGFTMIEIALSLAIIGFALVAIVGVLPQGLNVQKSNREDTLINQDGPFLLEALRSGSKGVDSLSNVVDRVWVVTVNSLGTQLTNEIFFDGTFQATASNIVGLLSAPKGVTIARAHRNQRVERVEVEMRSLTGGAVDQSPAGRDLAFRYRVLCEVQEVFATTNLALSPNLYEIRLHYRWPVLGAGASLGPGRQTFRTQFSGTMTNLNPNGYFAMPLAY